MLVGTWDQYLRPGKKNSVNMAKKPPPTFFATEQGKIGSLQLRLKRRVAGGILEVPALSTEPEWGLALPAE